MVLMLITGRRKSKLLLAGEVLAYVSVGHKDIASQKIQGLWFYMQDKEGIS